MGVSGLSSSSILFLPSFNGKLKIYIGVVDQLEKWSDEGRKRMEELLNPETPFQAEDKVLMTMELGEDISKQLEITESQQSLWNSELGPSKATETSPESKTLETRMEAVKEKLTGLNSQSETEAAKFGEDVKHLADVTNSTKKFNPWVEKSEAKVKAGMRKADSLEDGKVLLEEINKWAGESSTMKTTLDNGNTAAQKMTTHGEADKTYAEHQEMGAGGP